MIDLPHRSCVHGADSTRVDTTTQSMAGNRSARSHPLGRVHGEHVIDGVIDNRGIDGILPTACDRCDEHNPSRTDQVLARRSPDHGRLPDD